MSLLLNNNTIVLDLYRIIWRRKLINWMVLSYLFFSSLIDIRMHSRRKSSFYYLFIIHFLFLMRLHLFARNNLLTLICKNIFDMLKVSVFSFQLIGVQYCCLRSSIVIYFLLCRIIFNILKVVN